MCFKSRYSIKYLSEYASASKYKTKSNNSMHFLVVLKYYYTFSTTTYDGQNRVSTSLRFINRQSDHITPVRQPFINNSMHTEKSFLKLVKSHPNQIVFTIVRLILNQTELPVSWLVVRKGYLVRFSNTSKKCLTKWI